MFWFEYILIQFNIGRSESDPETQASDLGLSGPSRLLEASWFYNVSFIDLE